MTVLPQLERDLYAAAQQRLPACDDRPTQTDRPVHASGHRRPWRWLGRTGAVVPLLVSVVVAIGIAAAAIFTLGHQHPPAAAPATSSLSAREQLLDTFGVLRRPQTRADLLALRPGGEGGELPGIFRAASSRLCHGKTSSAPPCTIELDKGLVRSVDAGRGYRVAIFPTTIKRAIAHAQPGPGVVIALRGPGLYVITSITPTSLQAIRDHGLLLSDYVSMGINRGAILVPDGVATITLDHFRLLAPTKATLDQIPSTTTAVTDNVGLLQIRGLTEHDLHLNAHALGRYLHQGSGHGCKRTFAVYALPATAQMTWLSASHTTIRRTILNFWLDVGTHHPYPRTVRGPACAS